MYVAPERLGDPRFRDFAARAPLSLIAVDEPIAYLNGAGLPGRRIWASVRSSRPFRSARL